MALCKPQIEYVTAYCWQSLDKQLAKLCSCQPTWLKLPKFYYCDLRYVVSCCGWHSQTGSSYFLVHWNHTGWWSYCCFCGCSYLHCSCVWCWWLHWYCVCYYSLQCYCKCTEPLDSRTMLTGMISVFMGKSTAVLLILYVFMTCLLLVMPTWLAVRESHKVSTS